MMVSSFLVLRFGILLVIFLIESHPPAIFLHLEAFPLYHLLSNYKAIGDFATIRINATFLHLEEYCWNEW